jgi:hypothetical protein
MRPNFYSLLQKRMVKALALACFMILAATTANAQYRQRDALTYGGGGNGGPDPNGWGISFSAGYDGPTGDMRSYYSGAPAYSFSILKNWNGFTFNGTVGYVSYKPKQDTSYIDVDGTQVGYVKYDNYNSLEFFVGGAYNIPAADIANLYIGLNVGAYDNSFKYEVNTLEGNTSASTSGMMGLVAPKIGLNFMISSHFTFGIEGRYNFQFGSSKANADTDGYGYSAQSVKTYTVSGLLSYYF